MLVDVLRNTIHREAMRLPTVFAAFVAQAAFLFLHPEHEIFPLVAYTVVYKPFLELRDLPLYATLIHSSNTTHGHQERQWLLELLLDGLKGSSDYRLYKKKGVLPHLMVLHESPFVNKKTKTLILHFLLKACAIPSAAIDLAWNHGFFPWLQGAISSTSQVQHCSPLLVNIVSVLQQTLSKCEYRREKKRERTVAVVGV